MSARLIGPACLLSLLLGGPAVEAAPPGTHTDEALVPTYELPDPLKFADGSPVKTPEDWLTRRRPELLNLFTTQMFGKAPDRSTGGNFYILSRKSDALGGAAIRMEVAIDLAANANPPQMTLLLYIPQSARPAPLFLGLNFRGNHTATEERDVILNPNWMEKNSPGVVDNHATEESRGTQASRWQIPLLISRGYAVGTIYYGDIDPDFDDGFENGVQGAYRRSPLAPRRPDAWGSIAAWAWGLSRALDYLQTEPDVDIHRVAVIGHSRLGKTALWAGAVDPRFAMVISNDSGCGGAALSRREFGETVKRINTSFPHWFCENFRQYGDNVSALPFDQHELIALIAPRPVYIASASEDLWADPKGEYLSARFADPVYRLLRTDGLGGSAPPEEPPAVNHPLKTGTIGYHNRTGKHDITQYDWEQYLDFADRHLRKP